MPVDILIFAVIAAILIYRLNAVLGTRHGDEKPQPNPFDTEAKQPASLTAPLKPARRPARGGDMAADMKTFSAPLIAAAADADGQVSDGLKEIESADPSFDAAHFMSGARQAFGLIVDAYARGDRAALKPLLSPKLYADFDRGLSERTEEAGVSAAGARDIKAAHITAAHLGGTMAYITIEYEAAAATGDTVTDIWTFTRDTRSSDPNWMLIETRTAEK